MGCCVAQGENIGPGSEGVSGTRCMDMSRAGDASERKCTGTVSSPVICRGMFGQIFKLLTAADSLLATGSNGTYYNVLSLIYYFSLVL